MQRHHCKIAIKDIVTKRNHHVRKQLEGDDIYVELCMIEIKKQKAGGRQENPKNKVTEVIKVPLYAVYRNNSC